MPGMSPSFAASRKHARHMPKSRMYARLRPQRKQRRTTRDLNLGGRFERATVDFFAIVVSGLAGYSPFLGSYDSAGIPRTPHLRGTKRDLTEKRSPIGLGAIYAIGSQKSNNADIVVPDTKGGTYAQSVWRHNAVRTSHRSLWRRPHFVPSTRRSQWRPFVSNF